MRYPALLRRRELWIPTAWGWLAILVLGGLALLLGVRNLHDFLSPNEAAGARLLAVEGWLAPEELDQAVAVFRAGGYERIVTTGGPIPDGVELFGRASYAEFARDQLIRRGVPEALVIAVPAPASAQDRTFLSAVMIREWAKEAGAAVDALDVFSSGVHSRRTRLVYRLAFGSGARIGILAARPSGYDPEAWWRSSTGTKTVLSETVGWIWTKLFFRPGPAGSHAEKWGEPPPAGGRAAR
jgi:hypothetical protein